MPNNPQLYVVKDPLSGYKFTIDSPFPLDANQKICFHPAYTLPLEHIIKHSRKILLRHPHYYSLATKRLALSLLIYKLSETKLVEILQFDTLHLSNNLFNHSEFFTKFFYVLPKLLHASPRLRKRLPRFRITGSSLGSIEPWIDLCIQKFNTIDEYRRSIELDEDYLRIKREHAKWKLYSTKPDTLPKRVIDYLWECVAASPAQRLEWNPYLRQSAGTLYLKHRIRSIESVDLFWGLLECVDHIETFDYQNDLTRSITKWLKQKIAQWVDWHPQFLELSLDYMLWTPKKKAVAGLADFWVKHEESLVEVRKAQRELKESVAQRIARIRHEQRIAQESEASKTRMLPDLSKSVNESSGFTIEIPESPAGDSSHE